jgi:hypothetical protein
MKHLLLLAAPLLALSAVAQDQMHVVGRIKMIDFHPNVIVTVKNDLGVEEQVYLGQPNDWRGISNFLDRRDTISVIGRKDPNTSWIVAERMWINGSHFTLPRTSLSTTGAGTTFTTSRAGVRAALTPTREIVDEVISAWMDEPKKTANDMIAKYGVPDEITRSHMVWHNNGPWKKTILVNEEIDHDFPMPHHDMLLQVIDYKVPVNMFDELAAYDGSVIVERTKGEIGARCDKEAANFLAINLANDVVKGNKTPEQARQFYADAVSAMMNGNLSAQQRDYTSKFVFDTTMGDTRDKDRRHGG